MKLISSLFLVLVSSSAWAVSGGGGDGWSLGIGGGISASSQSDVNELIKRANTRESGVSTGQLGNAWEIEGQLGYRFSGSIIALHFRPSYFFQSADGTNSSGDKFEYKVNGFTIFPIFRFYLLESNFVKFYTQLGIGWGFVTGTIHERTFEVAYSGNAMGYMGGLGAEFCFFGGPHCISLEGNMRYLSFVRVTADSFSGTPTGGISQPTTSGSPKEVEIDDKDFAVTMSGIQGLIGYNFYF